MNYIVPEDTGGTKINITIINRYALRISFACYNTCKQYGLYVFDIMIVVICYKAW